MTPYDFAVAKSEKLLELIRTRQRESRMTVTEVSYQVGIGARNEIDKILKKHGLIE